MDAEYDPDEVFPITSVVLDFKISMDDADAILDRFLEGQDTEEDNERIVEYAIQLLYVSGIRETSMRLIHEKMQTLMQGRSMYHLEKLGLIELSINSNGTIVATPIKQEKCNESDL